MFAIRSARAASPLSHPDVPSDHGWGQEAAIWLVALLFGAAVAIAVLLLGPAAGDLFFRGRILHPLPAYASEVIPKPAQFGRYTVALVVAFASAGAVAFTSWPRARLTSGKALAISAPVLVLIGPLALLAVMTWAWRGQNKGINYMTPVQFNLLELCVAVGIALALILLALRGSFAWIGAPAGRRRRWVWVIAAASVTGLWLAPAIYRSSNLAHAMSAVWYPLQFTFDDFMSVLDGRTPMVNYDTQYASLLPFVTEPVFKLFGTSVGTFTILMWVLSLLSLMCLERVLALVARDERIAFMLYIPVLAISLLVLRHAGNERYLMANYYAVIPIRYVGPCVLLWCSVCHLRGLRPRQPVSLFVLAGLVAINNTDFGAPALGGCLLALASARVIPFTGALARLRRLGLAALAGVVAAALIVSVFTLLRAGGLPQLARLTRYEDIYAVTGFYMFPTPTAGLHIIVFMTFAAALLMGCLRTRSQHLDQAMTGALIFSGTFGLGAGFYYMGRSFPEVLAALFPAWGLATALLCLLGLKALSGAAPRTIVWPSRLLPAAAVLILLGLFATAIREFPAPWSQLQRIKASSHMLQFDTEASVRFVRASSRRGERVALLAGLGHLIGRQAGVIDVSPYSNPDGIVTYEQVDDVIDELRSNHGEKIYTRAALPEVVDVLSAQGFHQVAVDQSSALVEWCASGKSRACAA
jgi:hypothetical protein